PADVPAPHRARHLKGRPAAGHRPRHGPDRAHPDGQGRGLGGAAARRAAGGMTMRDTVRDVPIRLEEATLQVGRVTLLDRISIELATSAITVVIGPNGSGKTTLLRLAMALLRPTRRPLSSAA